MVEGVVVVVVVLVVLVEVVELVAVSGVIGVSISGVGVDDGGYAGSVCSAFASDHQVYI